MYQGDKVPGRIHRNLAWGFRALLAMLTFASLAMFADPARAEESHPAATGRNVARALLLDATRAGERIVAVGERGIVLYSDDEGTTWNQATVPVDPTLTAVTFVDARHGWATGHDATILATADGGLTWVRQFSDPELDVPLLALHFENLNTGFAVGGRGNFFRTTDGGATWSNEAILTRDDFDGHLFGIGKAASGSFFMASEQGVLFRSDDGGATWQQLDSPYNGSFFGVTFHGDRVLAYGMRGNVAVSDDNGASWRMVPTGTEKSFMSATATEDGALVLAGLDGAIVTTRDGGDTFALADQQDRRKIARLLPTRDGAWLAFGENGVNRLMLEIK